MEKKIAYRVKYTNPHRHFVELEMTVSGLKQKKLQLQLPAWRPGRYELAHFAKNIQRFEVFDASGHALNFRKQTKDTHWLRCALV